MGRSKKICEQKEIDTDRETFCEKERGGRGSVSVTGSQPETHRDRQTPATDRT